MPILRIPLKTWPHENTFLRQTDRLFYLVFPVQFRNLRLAARILATTPFLVLCVAVGPQQQGPPECAMEAVENPLKEKAFPNPNFGAMNPKLRLNDIKDLTPPRPSPLHLCRAVYV